jgi:ribosomal protein S8E
MITLNDEQIKLMKMGWKKYLESQKDNRLDLGDEPKEKKVMQRKSKVISNNLNGGLY